MIFQSYDIQSITDFYFDSIQYFQKIFSTMYCIVLKSFYFCSGKEKSEL